MNLRTILSFGCLSLLLITIRASADEKPGPFDARLLEIAKEYPRYGRVDDESRWAPELCRLPNPSTARFSQSDDPATHGEKLYFLFAKHRAEYIRLAPKPSATDETPDKATPKVIDAESKSRPAGGTYLGQVVVKEAWKAKEVPADEKPKPVYEALKKLVDPKAPRDEKENESLRGTYLPYAKKEGKLYKAHEKAGLYIMFQLDPQTADTDEGWVYGTLTADGKTVTSAGRIESCMKCHQEAPHGRLFGLAPKK